MNKTNSEYVEGDEEDESKEIMLQQAVKTNNISMVMQQIHEGAFINAPDASGNTPLIVAAAKGYHELVKVCIAFLNVL